MGFSIMFAWKQRGALSMNPQGTGVAVGDCILYSTGVGRLSMTTPVLYKKGAVN